MTASERPPLERTARFEKMANRVTAKPDIELRNVDKVSIEEIFRLGVLHDGIRLLTSEIRFPILGQVVPRVEIEITGPGFEKKVTVRVNQNSPFFFDGMSVKARINGEDREVAATQFVDEKRARPACTTSACCARTACAASSLGGDGPGT
ncbi:hypothetical protein ABH926_009198 [Catenulispora sp. GP43]|uniref:hypothetical protein n=1 Tax=Catenulispora sp. GP43 TaxID=3156263 RepID=UPI0035114DA2